MLSGAGAVAPRVDRAAGNAMSDPRPNLALEADDASDRVLDAMLAEAIKLMNELSSVGDRRAHIAGPTETAVTLRVASRLARVAAWLLTRGRDDGAAETVDLREAAANELDAVSVVGPISDLAVRVDRLAGRAVRLEAMLRGAPPPSADAPSIPAPSDGAAKILPFRPIAAIESVEPAG